MRVEFKKDINEKLHELYYELERNNLYNKVECVYLNQAEWDDLMNSLWRGLGPSYPYPKRIAIHEPLKVVMNDRYGAYNLSPTVYQTEEIEYLGLKIRREYK